jgi:N6-adenosine-specific RNA methylase IME4
LRIDGGRVNSIERDAGSVWPFGTLTPFKYQAIIADPPWAYSMRSSKGYEKSPEAHYSTMNDADIARLPVHQLADGSGCILFMWAIWPKLTTAMDTMRAWGFTYKTGGAWHKTTNTGKTAFGTGYILRSACEPFLIGTMGKPRTSSRSIRNIIVAERREHSRKPDDMRANVEKLMPDAWRCELFARSPWAGNDVWGNQTDHYDENRSTASA